jgi:hypothetical protein
MHPCHSERSEESLVNKPTKFCKFNNISIKEILQLFLLQNDMLLDKVLPKGVKLIQGFET